MLLLPNGSGWPWRMTKKENNGWRSGSYPTVHVFVLIKGVVDVGMVVILNTFWNVGIYA